MNSQYWESLHYLTMYHNNNWKTKRKYILTRDQFLDQELLRYGKHVQADTVHHIFPIEFYPELKYVDWNLISLSRQTHNGMHIRNKKQHGNLTPKGIALQQRYKREYLSWCKEHNKEPYFMN